jgi:peroxiredoxin
MNLTLMLGVLLAAAILVCFILIINLLRQSGRLLLRIEVLERLASAGQPPDPHAAHASSPAGLPIGSAAPTFDLPGLEGGRVTLEEFRGQQVLLTFFSPTCGFCQRMVPDLARLPQAAGNGHPLPLLITNGNAEENRKLLGEAGIRFPVGVQREMDVASQYKVGGTPMGYIIDEQGLIASEVAVGADQILRLAESAPPGSNKSYKGNKSLADSRILRSGLPAGTAAPEFTLPSVDGGEISLSEYLGQPVLLVFSDPDCGPCNQLAPKLDHEYRQSREVQVLMVSRGEVESNKAKVREHGLTFPVALQRRWEVSQAYGMFATPIAFLINEQGVIEADAATGVEPILTLFSSAVKSRQKEGMSIN